MFFPVFFFSAGCAGESVEPAAPAAPAPAVESTSERPGAPEIAYSLPNRDVVSPAAIGLTPELAAARRLLAKVVEDHGRDPENPWAISHAMLALGPEIELTNGISAIDHVFAAYAEEVDVGGVGLVRLPRKRGSIRIEPHTDLLLKAFTESGVSPNRAVTVAGNPHTVGDLYRHSLSRAWVDGEGLSFDSWNDTPWALQALSTWAPEGYGWTADGHQMTMDAFTTAVVTRLHGETQFIRDGIASGETIEKRGQGIFSYTCGGAHLIQGAGWAVARGFGSAADRSSMEAEVPALFHRVGVELAQLDAALKQHPDYLVVLLVQRMKFLGHLLESTHKLAALGIFAPTEAERTEMSRVAAQLVATVAMLHEQHVFDNLDKIRAASEQTYLDVIGDAAHSVRGIDLATGQASVRY